MIFVLQSCESLSSDKAPYVYSHQAHRLTWSPEADSVHFDLEIKYSSPAAMGVKEGYARYIGEDMWEYSDGKCVIQFHFFSSDSVCVNALKSTDVYECGFGVGVPGTRICLIKRK